MKVTTGSNSISRSGNKDDPIAVALETFEGDEKRLLKEALYLLLGEQSIMSNEFPDQIWKVCKEAAWDSYFRETWELNEAGQHVQ